MSKLVSSVLALAFVLIASVFLAVAIIDIGFVAVAPLVDDPQVASLTDAALHAVAAAAAYAVHHVASGAASVFLPKSDD